MMRVIPIVDFFDEVFNALSGEDFEERPVMIEEFVTSEDYLGLPPLSDYQYEMIRAGSQIYRYETLVALYGEQIANERYKETYNEIVLQLGKGSGKDYTSTIVCSYVVYLLLCLKDPSKYYGKPSGDTIDIVNVAVNADQARNVFFANFVKRIKQCPWFEGRYIDRNNSIEFDKAIRVFSGHSQREAFEGLNLFLAVLDEISAFELESNTGNAMANTADATYKMYRASVDSRFPDFGKVYLLSFPRFNGDYIQQRYGGWDEPDKGIIGAIAGNGAMKEVTIRKHTFKIDPDLPDGTEGNEFDIEWEEDNILAYSAPRIYALKRPTWEVNPTVSLDSPAMIRQFLANKADALGRFACMPDDNVDESFFKNKEKITNAFIAPNGVDQSGVFLDSFVPRGDVKYYMHVDLSKVHDRCAVAVAHVDGWKKVEVGEHYSEIYPIVKVDALRWWKPSHGKPMDYKEVTDFILAVKNKGFNIGLVTFDRWNSNDTMNFLNDYHIKTELLSVANKHYDDFLSTMYDERLIGPKDDKLIEELRLLRYIKDKVDHPRSNFKDLSDAVCGAIFNAVAYTKKPSTPVVEVVTAKTIIERNREEERRRKPLEPDGVIRAPKRNDMPDDLRSFLDGLRAV